MSGSFTAVNAAPIHDLIALLQPKAEKPLRPAKRTVDGLVVVLARPGLRVTPLLVADEPCARSARNDLP